MIMILSIPLKTHSARIYIYIYLYNIHTCVNSLEGSHRITKINYKIYIK